MAKADMRNAKALTGADLRKLYRGMQKDSRGLLQAKFQMLADRHRAVDAGIGKAAAVGAAALGRLLATDEEYAAAIKPVIAASRRELLTLQQSEARLGRPLSRETALGILSGSGIRDMGGSLGGQIGMTMAKDVKVDVRVPPYDDAWTDLEGGRHQQQRAAADKTTGRFGFLYTIGQEGGALWCGAGVEVLFMRQQPGSPPGWGTAGLAQIRTYAPYGYVWRDQSYAGTAHQHAGFGVLVWSASIDGGPSRTDLDHEYWTWSDGTSWYEKHENPSFPGRDFDTALQFGNEAPYFTVEPGRIYGAWIWCFADADAHGADVFSAGYAQASIDATAKLIVIGQQ